MRLVENGVFNTEALKYSIKRLNQLGYFKALEGRQGRQRREDAERDEQGRRQAEARGAEPQPADLRRRRVASSKASSASCRSRPRTSSAAAKASRCRCRPARARRTTRSRSPSRSCSTATSPAASTCSRPTSATSASSRRSRPAASLTFGFPLGSGFTRMFTNYSYERVRVTEINDAVPGPDRAAAQPVPARLAADRRRAASASSARSRRASSTTRWTSRSSRPPASASRRRSTWPASAATPTSTSRCSKACGSCRQTRAADARHARARPSTSTRSAASKELPIFEKLFLGGEYSIRGFDIRTIGPQDPTTGLVLGGNKSLLFNVEEQITIAGPVRLIALLRRRPGASRRPFAAGRPSGVRAAAGAIVRPRVRRCRAASFTSGKRAFKTSTGAEVRFFMPVLNVPFRLIFAVQPAARGRARQPAASRRRRSSSGLRSGSTF